MVKYNIVYSCDDNYAMHTGISIISLIENNKDKVFCIWIIENEISEINREYLNIIQCKYDNVEIRFIDFSIYRTKLKLNMLWNISISTYARLFILEILPEDVKTALYLDADVIIVGDIQNIFICLDNDTEAVGVQDVSSNLSKERIQMDSILPYINAGVLGLNLNIMRAKNRQKEFLEYINRNKGQVYHHDQGVINAIMQGCIKVFPPNYNYMTPFCTMKYKDMKFFYSLSDTFYCEEEIVLAKKEAIILHYTPGFVGRPWEIGCKHPLKDIYLTYKNKSPWRDIPLCDNKISLSQKVERWLYTHLPVRFAKKIMDILGKTGRQLK